LAGPDRTQKESIRIEKADQVFRFDAPRRPRAVLFDPEDAILKKVTFKKPRDELLWQLANAGSTWPRIEACRDLGKLVGDPKAIEGLEAALKEGCSSARRPQFVGARPRPSGTRAPQAPTSPPAGCGSSDPERASTDA